MIRVHDGANRWKRQSRLSLVVVCVVWTIWVSILLGCADGQETSGGDGAVGGPDSVMAGLDLTYIGEAVGPNANLTYYLQGPSDGEVVVLLPGMGRGADDFNELAAALNEAGYRTVAMQPRGIGRSGPILTEPSYDQFADDVALVVNDLPGGITGGRVHVLGYQFGNRIARKYAVKYPDHIGSLILLACGGQETSSSDSSTQDPGTGQSDSGAAPIAVASAVSPATLTEGIDSFFGDLVADTAGADSQEVVLSGMTAAFAFWLTPSQREPYVQHAFFAPMSEVPYYWITGWYRDTGWMQEQMDVDHVSPTADWVSGGNALMLIMQGEYDVAAPVSNGTYMQETYPDRVTLVVVPDAGHAMLTEQVVFISDSIISYLDEHPIEVD